MEDGFGPIALGSEWGEIISPAGIAGYVREEGIVANYIYHCLCGVCCDWQLSREGINAKLE